MGDEIRVTVVATGLGARPAVQAAPRPVEVAPKATAVVTDYRQFDRPAATRTRSATAHTMPQSGLARAVGSDTDMDYLDIPAFLRRQAD
jgi:cell division protein FtsZ